MQVISSLLADSCNIDLDITKMYDIIQLGNIEIFNWIKAEYNFCFDELITINYNIPDDRAFLNTEDLKRCLSVDQIFIIPVRILFSDGLSHYTGLMFNPLTQEVEYYDPNGSERPWTFNVDQAIKSYIATNYPTYRYISLFDYCVKGPQSITNDNWCYAWTTFYFYLRGKYPEISRQDLVVNLVSFGKDFLDSIIDDFICFLIKETKILDILESLYRLKEVTDSLGELFKNIEITDENAVVVIEGISTYRQVFQEIQQLRYEGKQKELIASFDGYLVILQDILNRDYT